MSSEEDIELRDLVAQTLEVNGCLAKIRAQLRASIFLALDEDEELQKKEPLLNERLKSQLESHEGRTMFCLVREFLEYFDLDFTISVYEPESYLGTGYKYEGRAKVAEDLGVSQLDENSTLPLLLQLIRIAQLNAQTKNIDIDLTKLQNEPAEEPPIENGTHNNHTFDLGRSGNETVNNETSSSVSEDLEQNENSANGVLNSSTEELDVSKDIKLNETFSVNVHKTNLVDLKKAEVHSDGNKPSVETILSPRSLDSSRSSDEKKEDSLGESVKEQDTDKSISSSDKSQGASSETEFSPPIVRDTKSHSKFDISFDKLKLSPQKTEKLKAKGSLSSLADLPPLQLSKSRNDTVLLPSLYSKEFKEKASNQNVKELDKFFDVDVDNYEEDFISDSEINLNKSLDNSRNLLEELQSTMSVATDSDRTTSELSNRRNKLKNSSRGFMLQKPEIIVTDKHADSNQNSEINKTENVSSPKDTISASSDDLNLNVDDILNSPTSN